MNHRQCPYSPSPISGVFQRKPSLLLQFQVTRLFSLLMEGEGILALAEGLIRYVSDRYGDLAAWIAGIVVLVFIPLLIGSLAIKWLT